MIVSRETIYGALLAQLEGATSFATVTRIPLAENSLDGADLPALEMLEPVEDAPTRPHGVPAKWSATVLVMIYASTGQPGTPGVSALNPLIDAIEAALAPDRQGRFTLGGVVYDCRIVGKILKDPAYQSGVGAAAIPVEITTTS